MYTKSKFQIRVADTADNDKVHTFGVYSETVSPEQVQTNLTNLKSTVDNALNQHGVVSMYGVSFAKDQVLETSFSIETSSQQKFFPCSGVLYEGFVDQPAQGRAPVEITF